MNKEQQRLCDEAHMLAGRDPDSPVPFDGSGYPGWCEAWRMALSQSSDVRSEAGRLADALATLIRHNANHTNFEDVVKSEAFLLRIAGDGGAPPSTPSTPVPAVDELTWTTTVPAELGWYWIRSTSLSVKQGLFNVLPEDIAAHGLWIELDMGSFFDFGHFEFAGPIPVPSTKESERQPDTPLEDHGPCRKCKSRPAAVDYNGHDHWVCEGCYRLLENEFEEEYK